MAFIKKGSVVPTASLEEAKACVAVAQQEAKPAQPEKYASHRATAGRDFDAEARGKTRCALEEAWAQSPLLPMLIQDPSDKAALHALLDELVTERMKRVFPNG
jgi:hypothetical protein